MKNGGIFSFYLFLLLAETKPPQEGRNDSGCLVDVSLLDVSLTCTMESPDQRRGVFRQWSLA